MNKIFAKEYYERLLLLRVQLFMRAVAFGGTLLIFSKLYSQIVTGTILKFLGLQGSYMAALVIVFLVSSVAATIDFPIRYICKKIKKKLSRKSR